MAELRERPYPGCHFLVVIGAQGANAIDMGFSEVIFPPFALDAETPRDAATATASVNNRLMLKRGVTGDLSLYSWWHRTRTGRTTRARTVDVQLLNEDHSKVVLTWRFRNARPHSLTYSPLRAMASELVIETLELTFDQVEMR